LNFEFEYLYFFLLIPLLICLYLCPNVLAKQYFPHLNLFSKFNRWFNREKLTYALILALIITALASPISYEQKSPNHRKGRDLVIVLDTSGSMGESGYNNEQKTERKFDAVRKILSHFILKRYDDNIGVVVFGNFAFASTPLTYDRSGLNFLLSYLQVGMAGDNTAIGDGLMQGISLLDQGHAQKKVMILLSDGYQNSGSFSAKEAVRMAKDKKIIIYSIGVGKASDYDKQLLEHIATQSGGKFFKAKDSESLSEVYDMLNKLEPSPLRSEHYLHKYLLFDIPLFFAIFMLVFMLIKRQRSHL